MKKIIKLAILGLLFILTGCTSNYDLLIKNAKQSDIVIALKDYVGINGYKIVFTDSTGKMFRVLTNSTVQAYGNTTFAVAQSRDYSVVISCIQTGKDVIMSTRGNTDDSSTCGMAEGFIDSLKNRYVIEIH